MAQIVKILNVFGTEYEMPTGEHSEIEIFGNDLHNCKTINIDAIIGAPIYGTVSEDKVVTLTATNLDAGVYKFKIVIADGSTEDLCTYEVV